MHQDPERRYASAQALGEDIESFLDGRAISARRDEASYVLRRFIANNKLLFAAAMSSIVFLVSGLVATGLALKEVEAQRNIAQAETQTALNAVTFLATTLNGANPHSGFDADATLSEVLERAEKEVAQVFATDAETRAYLLSTMAGVFSARGEVEKADNAVSEAKLLLEEAGTSDRFMFENYRSWGNVAFSSSRWQEAESLYEQALASLDDLPNHGAATDYVLQRNLEMHSLLCLAKLKAGDPKEGKVCAERVVTLHEGQAVSQGLASAHNTLAIIAYDQRDLTEAERQLGLATQAMTDVGLGDTPNALQLRMNRASLVSGMERWDEAEALYLETIALMEEALGTNHRWIMRGVGNLGRQYIATGHVDKALEFMQTYVDRIEDVYPYNDIEATYLRIKYASALCHSEQLAAGEDILRRSLAGYLVTLKPQDWRVAEIEAELAGCLDQQSRGTEALALLENAISSYESAFGAQDVRTLALIQQRDALSR